METNYSKVELHFIDEQLEIHGKYMKALLQKELKKRKIGTSGSKLRSSLAHRVTKHGADPVLELSFYSYGRAIEIRWHKMRRNAKAISATVNRDIWGSSGKSTKRKNTKWYAKAVYGSINNLLFKLSTELSNSERARIQVLLAHQKFHI